MNKRNLSKFFQQSFQFNHQPQPPCPLPPPHVCPPVPCVPVPFVVLLTGGVVVVFVCEAVEGDATVLEQLVANAKQKIDETAMSNKFLFIATRFQKQKVCIFFYSVTLNFSFGFYNVSETSG